jgi:exodeoxyribonuclease V beta subunit
MERFDLLRVPLAGVNLLEAGAGTGKTFTIEGLYLRLIIEKALPVGEILVVTYTVAATEELRDRIHRRLHDAVAAFSSGGSADSLLKAMLSKFPDPRERLLFQERLRAALRDFDEAAIFTIHGFCRRILQENAFESDALFDTALITDELSLREEIVDDFWRTHFYETLPEVAGYALASGFNPGYLRELLGKVIFHPQIEIIPRIAPPSPAAVGERVAAFKSAVAGLLAAWPEARGEVGEKLSSPALHANVYGGKAGKLQAMMDVFVASGECFPLPADLEKFTSRKLAEKTKKNQEPPDHDFFRICQAVREQADALKQELDYYLLFLKTEFAATVKKKLAQRKEKDQVMFFDDLLIRLRDALAKSGGEELAAIIGTRYRAAMIDEFQDTDPVQFAIFRTVFGRGAHPLFLIGDPKQAIYSFRGADIFAYMKAAADVQGKYTILENWRSEPGLIKAVNALFSGRNNPFVYEAIAFREAEAPPEKVYEFLTLQGRREPPFQFWFVPAEKYGEPGQTLAKDKAQQIIARAVAGEISRLLILARQGHALIGKRPLQEGDIAVLVRKHREARLLQDGLRRLKIPAVIQKTGNVFDTKEAEELERIMRALAAPEEERLVRAALLTDIMGVGVEGLEALRSDEKAWGNFLEKFGNYHDLWFEAGFMGMFASLMAGEGVKPRLLSLPDGERRVTNLLQLTEVLHRRSEEEKSGVLGLLQWLSRQRNPATPRLEEHQLRLESDERAVRIVTIHQSKGLEYPVVFCPFTWEGAEVRGDAFAFHGQPGAEGITCDLGSAYAAVNRTRAAREMLAENVRLLYVALTRARHRCYFIWGRFNKADTSAPAYLFHYGKGVAQAGDDLVAAVAADYGKLDDEAMSRQLADIALRGEGNIVLAEIPPGAGKILPPRPEERDPLTFREFAGKIDRSWRIASFSSLAPGQPHGAETPDYEGAFDPGELSHGEFSPVVGGPREASFNETEGARDIFSFPRGARAGTMFHEILRYLDFQEPDGQASRSLVTRKLQTWGFASRWAEVVISLLGKVVSAPLLPFPAAGKTEAPFTLSSLTANDRLNELEFYFPLRRLAPENLQSIFGRAGAALPGYGVREAAGRMRPGFSLEAGRLRFSPVRGFLKGFMDMVFSSGGRFYLVDWKSNFLGSRGTDYGPAALQRAMRENFYILQYHLYVLALHLYLGARLPDYRYERHFGGVYYFFLRGIDPALGPEYGIYRDRPEEGLIRELVETLL